MKTVTYILPECPESTRVGGVDLLDALLLTRSHNRDSIAGGESLGVDLTLVYSTPGWKLLTDPGAATAALMRSLIDWSAPLTWGSI